MHNNSLTVTNHHSSEVTLPEVTLPEVTLPEVTLPEVTTSSTAQGGGGSLKNRKPIGEIDCCESRMAERIH